MSETSDRRTDRFDNSPKMECRRANLRVLKEAAYLLWEDSSRSRLRCDWCELMGESGLRTLELLEQEDVLAPGGFVGIDLDQARIAAFRTQRPDLKWIAGNLYECLQGPELSMVGVLNLDEYGEVGTTNAFADFSLLQGLVQRGLDQFGEFALFWNQDLDSVVRRGKSRSQALRHHADTVSRTLSAWLPQRELTSEMLLPPGAEELVEGNFVGTLGAFEVYRGRSKGHRMANLRLVLR